MTSLRVAIWVAVVWCAGSASAYAQATPTDVYNRLLHVAAEVDLIRLEMGVDASGQSDIAVSGAQPREVYFQARTLFEKSNRLLFEQLRERADRPSAPTRRDITPDDVLQLVDASMDIVSRVRQSFGIDDDVVVSLQAGTQTPTDVYKLIIRINRTLNKLLQQRFAPADVYQQITYGVGLAASILATVTDTDRLGTEPEFVRRKTPTDVYRQLVGIYEIIHETMTISGQDSLEIERAEYEREFVSPSDVYDLASLVISELSHLHATAPGTGAVRDSFYPGDKLPSHVFQRTERLESQLHAMRRYASAHPDWLKPK